MLMPSDTFPLFGASYWGANLIIAVLNRTIPQWRLDDMYTRVMAAYYKVGGDAFTTFVNIDSWSTEPYARVPLVADSVPALVNEDV